MKTHFKQHQLLFYSLMLLIIGSLYYLFFREPIIASSLFGLESLHLTLYAPMFNALPSFLHQLAFILLTWLALNRSHMWGVILFWLLVNGLFELGQLASKHNTYHLPQILENYFQNGTYSHGDMIAIFLATLVAYIIIKNQKEN